MASEGKSASAFRTIGEVAQATGIAPHILRYWEGRFPQLRPVTRAGNRRYYRPADIALIERIDRLLNHDGYTIKGVQQLLVKEGGRGKPATPALSGIEVADTATSVTERDVAEPIATPPVALADLTRVRDLLRRALEQD